jgi:hypothetical protein
VDDVVAIALNANAKRLFLFHHDPGHDDAKIAEMAQWGRDFVTALEQPLEVDAAREGLEIKLERAAEPPKPPATPTPTPLEAVAA